MRTDEGLRVLLLARRLGFGGAERQLVNLACALARAGHQVAVAVFYAGGPLDGELAEAGVQLIDLRKGGRWDLVGYFARLVKALRGYRPDVVHSYLHVPNLVAYLACSLVRSPRLVWGVRNSNMDPGHYDRLARLSFRLERVLAGRPDLIIANSLAGKAHWEALGVRARRFEVVHNGIDVARFRPSRELRRAQRERWALNGEFVVGMVARLDPMKDHATLLRALAELRGRHPGLRAVLVGRGGERHAGEMRSLAARLGISGMLTWDAGGGDMPSVYNGLDLHVLSSAFGEGFPNAVAESMACGTPSIATDVGDSSFLLGDRSWVVEPRQPAALAAAIERLMELPSDAREALAGRSRDRVVREFSIEMMASRTADLLSCIRSA